MLQGRSRAPALAAAIALWNACGGTAAIPVLSPAAPIADVRSRGAIVPFAGSDGRELRTVHYAAGSLQRGELVYLHGIESHAGWFDPAATGLVAAGWSVTCLDRRGSGLNRESRGFVSGHVDRYATLLADVRAWVEQHPREAGTPRFLVGLSWGGKLGLAYALTRPDDFDGLVLITPGLSARVRPGLGDSLGILVSSYVRPEAPYPVPIEPEMFTETPAYLNFIRQDPLKLRAASARFLLESVRLDGFIDDHIAENRLPILLFLAGRDRIIDNEGVLALLARGGQRTLDVRRYEDQTHSIQFDATTRLVEAMTAWLAAPGDDD